MGRGEVSSLSYTYSATVSTFPPIQYSVGTVNWSKAPVRNGNPSCTVLHGARRYVLNPTSRMIPPSANLLILLGTTTCARFSATQLVPRPFFSSRHAHTRTLTRTTLRSYTACSEPPKSCYAYNSHLRFLRDLVSASGGTATTSVMQEKVVRALEGSRYVLSCLWLARQREIFSPRWEWKREG
ncbi:hypothetical protein BDQ17DRAFT_238185 [Cyathus striatus]|nr:hypothetical protein BDQ17DRAFT_238185 [Cyathus striatus]